MRERKYHLFEGLGSERPRAMVKELCVKEGITGIVPSGSQKGNTKPNLKHGTCIQEVTAKMPALFP